MRDKDVHKDPTADDIVCFLNDKTLCTVLGFIPSNPYIYGLEHPQLGHILVRRHMFVFPIIGMTDRLGLEETTQRVRCVNCRWMKKLRHPAAQHLEDAPIVATCWNPTFLVNGEKDYVLNEVIPADPYVHNRDGQCHGFENPQPQAAADTDPEPTS